MRSQPQNLSKRLWDRLRKRTHLAKLRSIRVLMENVGTSMEQAMDMLKIAEQDRPELRVALKERGRR